jgi:hypothetical protein
VDSPGDLLFFRQRGGNDAIRNELGPVVKTHYEDQIADNLSCPLPTEYYGILYLSGSTVRHR